MYTFKTDSLKISHYSRPTLRPRSRQHYSPCPVRARGPLPVRSCTALVPCCVVHMFTLPIHAYCPNASQLVCALTRPCLRDPLAYVVITSVPKILPLFRRPSAPRTKDSPLRHDPSSTLPRRLASTPHFKV